MGEDSELGGCKREDVAWSKRVEEGAVGMEIDASSTSGNRCVCVVAKCKMQVTEPKTGYALPYKMNVYRQAFLPCTDL